MNSPDQVAGAVKGSSAVDAPKLSLRLGEITAVNVEKQRVDITVGGAEIPVPLVPYVSNMRPTIGQVCWLLINGPDMLVLDAMSSNGPSVMGYTTSNTKFVQATRTATTFGALADGLPGTLCPVSPSGRILVGIGCMMMSTSAAGGAVMSFEVRRDSDNVVVIPPSDDRSMQILNGGANRWIGGSAVHIVEGIPAGRYSVNTMYRSAGGTATFRSRYIWTMPL